MAEQYNLSNIRALLTEGFTRDELHHLCHDNSDFKSVYHDLTPEMNKAQIVGCLLEYAERRVLLDSLLALTNKQNPARYNKYQPYKKTKILDSFQEANVKSNLQDGMQTIQTPSPRERILSWDHKESLYGIDLKGENLPGIELRGADLRASNFSKTNLFKANLSEAKLIGANLSEAKLQWANLEGADLSGADLCKADLSKAHMKRAKLLGANIANTILKGVTLTETDLSALDLGEADLSGVNMERAKLLETDLSRVNLKGANLKEAEYTEGTKWPEGFDYLKAGAIMVRTICAPSAKSSDFFGSQTCHVSATQHVISEQILCHSTSPTHKPRKN